MPPEEKLFLSFRPSHQCPMQAGLLKNFQIEDNIKILHLHCTSFFLSSEQKAYLEKVKQERLVKEELMSQDDEEDIPVTEREMNLKVNMKMVMKTTTILSLKNFLILKKP